MAEDNWFEKAAKAVEESERGVEAARRAGARKAALERSQEIERRRLDRLDRLDRSPRPAEASEAKAIFEAVLAGKAPPLGSGPSVWRATSGGGIYHPGSISPGGGLVGSTRPPQQPAHYSPSREPTPEQGLEAILKAIREAGEGHLTGQENADAVLKAGGEWITKVTNAITQIIRESDDES